MQMPSVLPLVPHPDLESRVKSIQDDGFVYFPGIMNTHEVAELRKAMDSLDEIPEYFDRTGQPWSRSFNNVFNRGEIFRQYLDKPGIIELVEEIHGSDCHVIGMTAWITGPGRPDQSLHVDYLPISLPPDLLEDVRVKIPIFITTAHYYLDDLHEALGPTKFVPGSHLSGRNPDGETTWKGVGEQSIICNAGDVLLFRSEVWHRGSTNTSNQDRYLLQVHYAQRMITQKFPPYLNKFQFDEELLSQLTPRQRRLLGEHRPANYD